MVLPSILAVVERDSGDLLHVPRARKRGRVARTFFLNAISTGVASISHHMADRLLLDLPGFSGEHVTMAEDRSDADCLIGYFHVLGTVLPISDWHMSSVPESIRSGLYSTVRSDGMADRPDE
jgi:hypothetical protein